MEPRYQIGDRIMIHIDGPFATRVRQEGTVAAVRKGSPYAGFQYEIDWDGSGSGLIGWYTEECLMADEPLRRENLLRRLLGPI